MKSKKYDLIEEIRQKAFESAKLQMCRRPISSDYLLHLQYHELRILHDFPVKNSGSESQKDDDLEVLEKNRLKIRNILEKRKTKKEEALN